MTKTLSVAAINNGTVIDHIESNQTLRIVNMLKLLDKKLKVTVGFNLPSSRNAQKDIIKIENHEITAEEANKVIVFAPHATINIIKNYVVVEKIRTELPKSISTVFICPNTACISNIEAVESFFNIEELASIVKLVCHYCEKSYERNQVGVHV